MARLPKDYSRHENKLFFGLSIKSLMVLFVFGSIAVLLIKSALAIILKILLLIPIAILGVFFAFYRTEEGDDFATYLITLIGYYMSPKYLVYKKQLPPKGDDENGKKDRR